MSSEFREKGLRFLVSNRGVDDHVLTLLPVHRCGHTVFVTDLQSCSRKNKLFESPREARMYKRTVNNSEFGYVSVAVEKKMERMYIPDDLVEVATGRGGISNCKTDHLLGVNYKHGTDL